MQWMRTLAIFLLLLGATSAAHACAVCVGLVGNPLAIPHPRAVEIALATRRAIEQRLLPGQQMVRSNGSIIDLQRVPVGSLIKDWTARLDVAKSESPWSIHVIFVDSGETCGVEFRGGGLLLQPRPSSHSDTRLITTRNTLHAILIDRMDLARAQQLGLLILEGEQREVLVRTKLASSGRGEW